MALAELVAMLKKKHVLGEYGAFTRPFVVLDVDEYHALIDALSKQADRPRRKVPHETVRAEA